MGEETKYPRLFAIDVDAMETVCEDPYQHIWGSEKWAILSEQHDLTVKFLTIYPGFQSSKHAHGNKGEDDGKWEYFIVLSGTLTLYVWDRDMETYPGAPRTPEQKIILKPGARYYIPEYTYHKFETTTRQFCLLLEVSRFENGKTIKLEASKQLY